MKCRLGTGLSRVSSGGVWVGMMDSLRLHRTSRVSLNMFYNVSLRIHYNLEALDFIYIILPLVATYTVQRLNYLLHTTCNKL